MLDSRGAGFLEGSMAADMIPPAGAAAVLARSGWAGANLSGLAGDASFRRYFRVRRGSETAVLMDAPPPREDVRPFLAMAARLEGSGLSVPKVFGFDLDQGLVLLEDFGDLRLTPLLVERPALETELYSVAIDILVAIGRHFAPSGLPTYDTAEYLREARLFVEWYLPALGQTPDGAGFEAAWRAVLADLAPHTVLTLRDYHADNLMLLEARHGLRRLGLLDFQDALIGHPAYDLVSLLQDARRDVAPALETAMIGRYLAGSHTPQPGFAADYQRLGAQRNTKILGIFARLWKRDGKPTYLYFMPRVWGHLERNLAHPALAPVRAWFDANVPAHLRAAAWIDAR